MYYRLSYNFLLGIAAYARQMALSIDRAYGSEFQHSLTEYFSNRKTPKPELVMVALREQPKSKSLQGFGLLAGKPRAITPLEFHYVFSCLDELDLLLETKVLYTRERAGLLRRRLSEIEYQLCLELKPDDVMKVRKVEYYGQDSKFELSPFESVVSIDWPEQSRTHTT